MEKDIKLEKLNTARLLIQECMDNGFNEDFVGDLRSAEGDLIDIIEEINNIEDIKSYTRVL